MTTASTPMPLAPEVRSLLARLRWRIRAYVWLEGIALAVIWVCTLFWIVFALDYLPILVGASEMPQAIRGCLLLVTAGGLAYITYRWILSRVFARLADRSMALLLERRFRNFRDSLVTSVELTEQPDHAIGFNPAMLTHTNREALEFVRNVRLDQIFNFFPLVSKLVTAGLLVISLLAFGAMNTSAFGQAARRIWLLDSQPWPRSSQIEIVGIEIQRAPSPSGQSLPSPQMRFENRRVKVAKGASVNVKVRANATAKVVPDFCTIYYRSEQGERGRVQMKKIGRVKNEEIDGESRSVQNFSFDGKPFKGILSTLKIDVIGNDHRLSDYRIEVVESPAVIETTLACEFPDYMVDPDTSSWLPRTVNYLATGTQLPRGTKITLHAKANKDLREAVIFNPDTNETTRVSVSGKGGKSRQFEFPIGALHGNLTLYIGLLDFDDVMTDLPQRIYIAAVPDDAPKVDAKLKGIGTSITADVVIPIRGTVSDDYGVEKTWFDVLVNDGQPQELPFALRKAGAVETEIDFRETRAQPNGIKLAPKDKLILKLMASDKCNLQSGPNIGSGDTYHLDVVTPEELLAQLEARELSLRQRFEQIIAEVTEMRDSLLRVKINEGSEDGKGSDPADKATDKKSQGSEPTGETGKESPPAKGQEPGEERTSAERARSLRLLRVQRAVQQSQKSGQEVLGVSIAFAEIREELINNRVDTEDRKQRLQEQIADPLRQIVDKSFTDLDRRLMDLEKKLDDPQVGASLANSAIQKTEDVLLELNDVLQRMLDLETYNELLDIVRDLIKEQQNLIDKTKQQKKQQLLDLTK